ncbi:hypothetical protein ACK34R_09885 [Aeromonas veronii]
MAYVSFAGTIVSIILAVLAIIYSFVQTQAQQSTSDSISREIFRLNDITTRIDDTSKNMTIAVTNLPSVVEKLESLPDVLSGEISNMISDLNTSTMTLHEKTESMKREIIEKIEGKPVVRDERKSPNKAERLRFAMRGTPALILASYMVFSGKGYVELCDDACDYLPEKIANDAIEILLRADAINESYYMINYMIRDGDTHTFNNDSQFTDMVFRLKVLYLVYAGSIEKFKENTDSLHEVLKYFYTLFEKDGFNEENARKKWGL